MDIDSRRKYSAVEKTLIKLHHLFKITLLAVDDFWPVWSVSGLEFVGAGVGAVKVFCCVGIYSIAGFVSMTLALALPELERVSLFYSLKMTAVRA